VGWFIGGGVIYIVLLITCGILTLRKGHLALFIIGIFLPFLWLVGAIMPAPAKYR